MDCLNEVYDLMEQSGCDLPLTLEAIPAISDCLIVYDALNKRSKCFEAIGEGLQVFKLLTAIKLFPETFKVMHVCWIK